MEKIIINQDTTHPIYASDFNYSVSYQIENYSNHSENFTCRVEGESIGNLTNFENTEIESIAIYDEENTLKTTLNFGDNFYLMTGSMNIFDGAIKLYVTFNTISMPNQAGV